MTFPTATFPTVTSVADLTPGWQLWDNAGWTILARVLPDGRYVAVAPFLFTHAIIVGRDPLTYDDRWCYEDMRTAVAAATLWSGEGEPAGWHRHPMTGRRRPDGDPAGEYVAP